jgi:hypothetical protein
MEIDLICYSPMKKIYTIIFAQNNINNDENYLVDLEEIKKNEDLVKDVLKNIIFYPRQKVIDNLLKFASTGNK